MKIATSHSSRVSLVLSLLFIGLGSLSAQFRMGNTLAPLSGSLYPIIYSNDALGGFHQAATLTERDAIPALRRQQGMLCAVLDAGSGTRKTYQLIGGIANTNWVEFTSLASSAGFSDLTGLPTTLLGYGITDGMSTSLPANGIAATDIAHWNNAYSWGDHAGLYRPISYVPAWNEITSNPFVFTSMADGQLLKYNSVTSKWESWTPTFTASQISNFQSSVSNNTEVLANTAKITNADHTGDVTGAQALTITDKAVTLSKMNDIGTQSIIGRNTAATGSPEVLDATIVKAILKMTDFNINRPITLSGNNNTGKNLGSSGQTIYQFLEAFFFPSVSATPPTNTFATATIPLTIPYSTWSSWSGVGNPPTKNIDFSWSVTNNSLTDNSDDKQITSIKLKSGATELTTVTPTGGTQNGTFNAIPFASAVFNGATDFSKTYTLEVMDAQPNTVLSNITLTMKAAIPLTYTAPTIVTMLYEYKNTDESVTLNWNITPNDEIISAISIDGAPAGSTASTGSKSVVLKSVTTGGVVSRTYPMVVTGSIYGAGATKNSTTVSWANRLYRGAITSAVVPSDGTFTFSDTQIKALNSENKLGGDWKATAGYDFLCGAGGQYVCFAYPDNAATPVVQYYDSNFSAWMTYSAADVTVINRSNFSNQYSYTGTNYKLVFINVQYINATVKLRLQ